MTTPRLFDEEGFDFAARGALGGAPYRLADIGEVLSTVDKIADYDADSWFDQWSATAERTAAVAEAAEKAGRTTTAREAYLRAAHYLGAAFFYVLATRDPSRSLATWRRHRHWAEKAFSLWPTPTEHVKIPYGSTTLDGWFFSGGDGPRPLVICNNGSDGPVTDMLWAGVSDAVARGWHALTFDGPGQGEALYEQKLFFRYDWEAVITPVVDWATARTDVDAARIALVGISQGGYWVPRALAFEHRITAGVADPGVVRVRDSWTAKMPAPFVAMLDDPDHENDAEFDAIMQQSVAQNRALALIAAKRLEPYGTDSWAAALRELERWDLSGVVGDITCPVMVTSPDDEQFWPGQAAELMGLLKAPNCTLQTFTVEEGASGHCEPLGQVLRGQRVFDWLESVMPSK